MHPNENYQPADFCFFVGFWVGVLLVRLANAEVLVDLIAAWLPVPDDEDRLIVNLYLVLAERVLDWPLFWVFDKLAFLETGVRVGEDDVAEWRLAATDDLARLEHALDCPRFGLVCPRFDFLEPEVSLPCDFDDDDWRFLLGLSLDAACDLDLDLDLELDLDRLRAADVALPRDRDVTDLPDDVTRLRFDDVGVDRDVDDDELWRRLRVADDDDDDDDADFDVEHPALLVDLVAERFHNNDIQLSYNLTSMYIQERCFLISVHHLRTRL